MIYTSPPRNLRAVFRAVWCLVVFEGTILLLLRKRNTPLGGLWGLPGGGVKPDEAMLTAMVRELDEEVGRNWRKSRGLFRFTGKVWAQHELPNSPQPDGIFYIYQLNPDKKFSVRVNPEEHEGHLWARPKELAGMCTVPDLEDLIKLACPKLL